MTDATPAKMAGEFSAPGSTRLKPVRSRHTARRFASESRFKYAGLAAVILATGFLVLLLATVVGNGLPAFVQNDVRIDVDLTDDAIAADPAGADYRKLVNSAFQDLFPEIGGRREKRALRGLVSTGAPVILRETVLDDRSLLGGKATVTVPLSDTADLYLKGLLGELERVDAEAELAITQDGDSVRIEATEDLFTDFVLNARRELGERAERLRGRAVDLQRGVAQQEGIIAASEEASRVEGIAAEEKTLLDERIEKARATIATLQAQIDQFETSATTLETRSAARGTSEKLTDDYPSLFLRIGEGVVKITEASRTSATGDVLAPLPKTGAIGAGGWMLQSFATPQSERKLSDAEIVWLEKLRSADRIESGPSTIFFTRGASREAEMAGIWGAVVGSFLTLVVTLALSFPISVASAIYLEEFAPKNRFTDLIEVNINNLAAVPSIVFGLLGLAVFLGFGGLPRSAPLVGGMVLALMTLPTIIIASRAALKAVPPSIREAALGIGASRIQAVFHHVLPLAMPGMLTGTIIGMAQALGETAPLLMIGMVAFIVDVPQGFTDAATVLPVQIYMWADFPEAAFRQKTAAAIMVLLGFLVLMNAIAVVLRKRFERRW